MKETEPDWHQVFATVYADTLEGDEDERTAGRKHAHSHGPQFSATMQVVAIDPETLKDTVLAELAIKAASSSSLGGAVHSREEHWKCCAVHGGTGEVRVLNCLTTARPQREDILVGNPRG